jgi:Helix-turn-helix domain
MDSKIKEPNSPGVKGSIKDNIKILKNNRVANSNEQKNITHKEVLPPQSQSSLPPFTAPVNSLNNNSTTKKKATTLENFKHPFMESLKEITKGIEYLIKQSNLNNNQDPRYIIIDNTDLIKLLKISPKTASNWREEGILLYSQVKGKIYYKLSDIHKLIDDNSYIGKKKV